MTETMRSTSDPGPDGSASGWGELLDTSRLEQVARRAGRRSVSDVPSDLLPAIVREGLRDLAVIACESLDPGHALVVEELLQDAEIAGDDDSCLPVWSALAQLLQSLAPFLPPDAHDVPVDAAAVVCERPVRDAARVGEALATQLSKRFGVRTVGDLLHLIDRYREQLLKVPRVTPRTLDRVLEWAREQSGCSDVELAAAYTPVDGPVRPVEAEHRPGGTSGPVEAQSGQTGGQAPSCVCSGQDTEPALTVVGEADEISTAINEAPDSVRLPIGAEKSGVGVVFRTDGMTPGASDVLVSGTLPEIPPHVDPGEGEIRGLIELLADAADWMCRSCGARYRGQPQPLRESALLRLRCTACDSGFCAPVSSIELARLRDEMPDHDRALRARIAELEAEQRQARSPFACGLTVLVDVVPWRFRGSMATLEAMLGDLQANVWNFKAIITRAREEGQAILVDSRSPLADGFIAVAISEATVFLRGAR